MLKCFEQPNHAFSRCRLREAINCPARQEKRNSRNCDHARVSPIKSPNFRHLPWTLPTCRERLWSQPRGAASSQPRPRPRPRPRVPRRWCQAIRRPHPTEAPAPLAVTWCPAWKTSSSPRTRMTPWAEACRRCTSIRSGLLSEGSLSQLICTPLPKLPELRCCCCCCCYPW